MKYKFFGILVLMLFSVFLNANYSSAQFSTPSRNATVDSVNVSVNGSQITVSVAGKFSVRQVGPQCIQDPEFSVFTYASESAQTGVVSITAGAGLTGQTIPVTITPGSPSSGDCLTRAEQYTFSNSSAPKTFNNISAGTYTITVSVTDDLGQTASKVSNSFTIAAAPTFRVTTTKTGTGTVDPMIKENVPFEGTVSFNVSNNATVTTQNTCPLGVGFSVDRTTYTTGKIEADCNVDFNFIPPLSCAVDTATTPAPHYTGAGVKFLASNGVGTYSWSAPGATPSTGTGNQIWPIYSTAGTKTVSVSTPTQPAVNCTVVITTPPPGPINGACASTHYNCSAGTSAGGVGDPSGPWTWNCNGLNGGTNASCSEAVTSPMSGTLTPSSSTCYISAGASTCTKLLTWTTTNPVAVSAVTSMTGTPSPSTNTNSGSQTFTIPYNSGNASIFYLYNNEVKLAEASVTPYCTSGTEWLGGVCQTTSPTEPDLTASDPTPNLATVNVARTFSSNISNIGGGSTVNSFSNFFQVASAANGGGTITPLASASTTALASGASRAITSPAHTFTTAGTYSVRACADKSNPSSTGTITESNENNNCSGWTNVTVGATSADPSGYFDVASCTDLQGWAYDSDVSSESINVKVYKEGNVLVGTYLANGPRPDVNTALGITGNHGFVIPTPSSLKDGVAHTLNVYAVDPTNGTEVLTGASPKSITCVSGPDLVASAPTPNTDVVINTVQRYTSTITNQGTGAVSIPNINFSNFWQVATDWDGGGTVYDLLPVSMTSSNLPAGGSANITYDMTFNGLGRKSMRACADKSNASSTGSITETNEGNNCSAWTNLTVISSASYPILSVGNIDLSNYVIASLNKNPSTAWYGRLLENSSESVRKAVASIAYAGGAVADLPLRMSTLITNTGIPTSTAFTNKYFIDLGNDNPALVPGVMTGWDIQTNGFPVTINGITSSVSASVDIPAGLPQGTHGIVFCSDITGAISDPAQSLVSRCTNKIMSNVGFAMSGTLTASNCILESGKCDTNLTWTTTDPEAIGTPNSAVTTPESITVGTGLSGSTTYMMTSPGSRTFYLYNNGKLLAQATAIASDSIIPSCTEIPSFRGSVTPLSTPMWGPYTVSCDFGVESGYIGASVGSGSCSWGGWTNGTQANFNCIAGGTPGSFSNNCIINYNVAFPYCSTSERVDNLTVTSMPGGRVNGVCSDPDDRSNPCLSGNPSAVVNGISSWTWSCVGVNGGTTESCEELKKKPIFIED